MSTGSDALKRPRRHLEALHRLTAATARAADVAAIHAEALDVLTQALNADRAAVLLFDTDQVMRFRAWRNLSASYRAAVEGHSPWSVDDPAPQPVLVPAVADDPHLGALRQVVLGEGINAVAFIPLLYADRLLGKFMVYFDAPHVFSDDEVDLARTVAGHIAFALEKQRLADELRDRSEELSATLNAVGEGITVQGREGLIWANDAAAGLMGFASAAELLSTPISDVLSRFEIQDANGKPFPVEGLPGRHALEGEEPPETLLRWRVRATGEERCSLVRARPVWGDGRVRFSVNVIRDVTERQVAAEALRRSEERFAFLASASRSLLGASLDRDGVATRVAELTVPAVASLCGVWVLDGEELHQIACRASDSLVADAAIGLEGQEDLWAAVRSGESMPVELPLDVAVTPACPGVVVPIRCNGQVGGALLLARAGEGYVGADLTMVEDLAARAGQAMDIARTYSDRAHEAATLSRALLPAALPDIPGVELAARYRPAESGIGGDFYDTMRLSDGSWLLVMGDVCGKGAEAAAMTAMARHTVRALAHSHRRPGELLEDTNRVLAGQVPEGRFFTIVCVGLRPVPGGARLVIANAGHPSPLVVRSSGELLAVGKPATMVGVFDSLGVVEEEVDLSPGDALVMFTDGCIGEGRDARAVLGPLFARASGASATALAVAVERVAGSVRMGHPDDIAVLVARTSPQVQSVPSGSSWSR